MIYDTHVHTNNSHDSAALIEDICRVAIEKGISGISITDHACLATAKERMSAIKNSVKQARAMQKRFDGKLKVFAGVELSELVMYPQMAREMLEKFEFDVVLGSVHSISHSTLKAFYSEIDFSDLGADVAAEFLNCYYNDMLEMAQRADFDVLSHLTCPLRYINGKHGFNFEPDMKMAEKILSAIIRRNIALEVNTSCIGGPWSEFMPDAKVLSLYKNLGGKMITLASDAHIAQNVGNYLDQAVDMIKQCGFDEFYYFENRTPVAVSV